MGEKLAREQKTLEQEAAEKTGTTSAMSVPSGSKNGLRLEPTVKPFGAISPALNHTSWREKTSSAHFKNSQGLVELVLPMEKVEIAS